MQAVNDYVKCLIWYIIGKEWSPKCTKCPMKSRTPVEGTLYALVSEEKKEKAPALNLEPTEVPMRSTIDNWQWAIELNVLTVCTATEVRNDFRVIQ